MKSRGLAVVLLSLIVLGGGAGCALPPYVHNPDEFNRDSETFRQEPVERRNVTICYSAKATTPEEVRRMAGETCGKHGKTARFVRHTRTKCPATFAAAFFACDGGSGSSWTGARAGGETATGPYNWSYSGPGESPLLPPSPDESAR
ncbi:MAG: hypothetical protein H7841_06135 [Magnetospirillum sp. WYHS-4]